MVGTSLERVEEDELESSGSISPASSDSSLESIDKEGGKEGLRLGDVRGQGYADGEGGCSCYGEESKYEDRGAVEQNIGRDVRALRLASSLTLSSSSSLSSGAPLSTSSSLTTPVSNNI